MTIKKVSIIGLGSLGILFGHYLAEHMPEGNLRIVADKSRINRYRQEGVYANDKKIEFYYQLDEEVGEPADLLIFAVKFNGLESAIRSAANQVGEHTLIMSTLNGISSEKILGEAFGDEKIIPCVAQGMAAAKVDNKLTYDQLGFLVFGDWKSEEPSDKVMSVKTFFDSIDFPYILDQHMLKRIWSKFMLNVGVNQTVAYYEGTYETVQLDGKAKEMMIKAMKEVALVAAYEGVDLDEADIQYWLQVLSTLNPQGQPSTRQDMVAKRYSEVELFAGTVIELAESHNLEVPVNKEFYKFILDKEKSY